MSGWGAFIAGVELLFAVFSLQRLCNIGEPAGPRTDLMEEFLLTQELKLIGEAKGALGETVTSSWTLFSLLVLVVRASGASWITQGITPFGW